MKKTKRNKRAIIDACKNEKDADVYKRLLLVKWVFVDEKSIAQATKDMDMSESWGASGISASKTRD